MDGTKKYEMKTSSTETKKDYLLALKGKYFV